MSLRFRILTLTSFTRLRQETTLNAGLSLARALCVRGEAEDPAIDFDLERIRKAILEVEKQAQGLDDIRKSAQSIRGSADRIDDRAHRRRLPRQMRRRARAGTRRRARLLPGERGRRRLTAVCPRLPDEAHQ